MNCPIGSIVYLTIDNGDGGIGIVLEHHKDICCVYRITHDDRIWVYPAECYVSWKP
jgi:hypothetical protein